MADGPAAGEEEPSLKVFHCFINLLIVFNVFFLISF